MMEENYSSDLIEQKKRTYDLWAGIVLSVFAACMAINDLGAGKYADDEMIAHNKQSAMYSWYQSKSLKQSITEGQRDLIMALVKSNTINAEKVNAMDSFSKELDEEVQRYSKEKKELLQGSKTVGKENWAQDVNGELGLIKGAEEWAAEAEILGDAGDVFDRATLFLQLSLVFGAISIVIQSYRGKRTFLFFMVASGILGTVISAFAFNIATSV